MKKIFKFILILLIVIYVVVVGFLTLCLFTYNEYGISEIGNKTLLIIEDDDIDEFEEGSLIVVERNEPKDIKTGDSIFFYNVYSHQVDVNYSKVLNTETIDEETTFTIEGNRPLSQGNVIGKDSTAKVYSSVGAILKKLESKWGYLFAVILPILFAFIYIIYEIVREIKHPKDEKKKN